MQLTFFSSILNGLINQYSAVTLPPNYLQKFELNMSDSGISPSCLERELDGISSPIYIPYGFPMGSSVHNRAYVSYHAQF